MSDANQHSLKEVLKEMVETYRLKNRLNQARIKELWEKQMGRPIARYTKDLKIRRNKLYVSIESASLRQELSFGKDKIKRILNEALGEDLIEEVVIR
jgi:predicted nucleic acid-binding Zn ribbon protein